LTRNGRPSSIFEHVTWSVMRPFSRQKRNWTSSSWPPTQGSVQG